MTDLRDVKQSANWSARVEEIRQRADEPQGDGLQAAADCEYLLNYLDHLTTAWRQERQTLWHQIEQLQDRRDKLSECLSTVQKRLDDLGVDIRHVTEDW